MVAQVTPDSFLLLLLHVLVLLLHKMLLRGLGSIHLPCFFHLLLLELLVPDHLHLVTALRLLDLLLLLHHHGVRLHVHRDDECGEGVSSHDTPVKHNVLRSDLTKQKLNGRYQ